MKKAACAALLFVRKHRVRSATERTSATAAAVTAAAVTTTTTTTTLAATASRQTVDAGARRIGLPASAAAAATRLVAARGKLIRHQRVDVAWQFVAIATRATLTAGCVLARRAVVAPVVESAFWARAVIAVAVKAWRVAPEFAVAPEFTTVFVATITPPAALGAAAA